MVWIRATLLLLLSAQLCCADPSLTLRQLEFKGWFGARRGDPTTVYNLLGCCYLLNTPIADDAEKFAAAWISIHPDAELTIVDRAPMTIGGDVFQSYVWIQDGDENLNLFLVRQGLVPGGVMQDGVAYLSTLPDIDETTKNFPKRLISDAQYDAFMKRVIDAEAVAAREHKGIWSDKALRQEDGYE